ncbi:MAG: thioredoxin domain-containing protein [Planctomycetes bacterium]|nr:thioredoxin domain-containing protein [Planctomycetota bacterium]|tara:strand:+ start:3761 stop:5869 length:2109 start_codon:yes stop_codon:yes gene_type:complete
MLLQLFALAPLILAPPQKSHDDRKANHLAQETSPYLLQHAYNPVNWYPWGKEALAIAKSEEKPIFLSIGYSACHWCHVMERESFEDEEIAKYLNEHFVCIKVDREERPDLDDLYMTAVQQMTGSGGWPMSVFLTPDRKPFFGGTYFPPRAKFGRPGFFDLLMEINKAWDTRRSEIVEAANQMGEQLAVRLPAAPDRGLPKPSKLGEREINWVSIFKKQYDSTWGGFGDAPKFPRTDDILLLLGISDRHDSDEARRMAFHSLHKMADGGMFDQLGGGFARYSTDAKWLIPHFEKMLYDQGTLIPCYLEAWRQSGDYFFERIARENCDYLIREMQSPGGGLWSSTDADSEGEEGKFFVWTPQELIQVLGKEDGEWAASVFGVTKEGNFEHGKSALTLRGDEQKNDSKRFQKIRAKLYSARSSRIPPATDDKILTAWNGLAIHALAQAGLLLGEDQYTQAAVAAGNFLLKELRSGEIPNHYWSRSWRNGKAQHAAVLEDYAYLARAFLSLFQATGNEKWLLEAESLAAIMVKDFWNPKTAVFFDTDGNDETVFQRRSSPWDGAIPSPNGIALESLVILHAFTHEARWKEIADKGFAAVLQLMSRGPRGFSATTRSLWLAVEEPRVAVVVGTGDQKALSGWRNALHSPGTPGMLGVFSLEANPKSENPLFANREAMDGKATLYLCRGPICLPPSTSPGDLKELLDK